MKLLTILPRLFILWTVLRGTSGQSGPVTLSATDCFQKITSSEFPFEYSNNEMQVWVIDTTHSDMAFTVSFSYFALEDGPDFVEIGYGSDQTNDATLLAHLTGSSLPSDISVADNSMWFTWQSDNGNTGGGFKALVSACSGVRETLSETVPVEIASSSYPSAYDNNEFEAWIFEAQHPCNSFLLSFTAFDVESTYDAVRVGFGADWRDGSTVVESLDGDILPPDIPVYGNAMWIVLETDWSDVYTGFSATVTCFEDVDECLESPGPCHPAMDCSNLPGSFVCACPIGSFGPVCQYPNVRLVDGTFRTNGRVEVFLHGEWGTVCDDDWSIEDGDVVCQQLGFREAESVQGSAFYGEGSGPIHLDDLACTGSESSLTECEHEPEDNCGHGEDAGVVCIPVETTTSIFTTRVEVTTTPDAVTTPSDATPTPPDATTTPVAITTNDEGATTDQPRPTTESQQPEDEDLARRHLPSVGDITLTSNLSAVVLLTVITINDEAAVFDSSLEDSGSAAYRRLGGQACEVISQATSEQSECLVRGFSDGSVVVHLDVTVPTSDDEATYEDLARAILGAGKIAGNGHIVFSTTNGDVMTIDPGRLVVKGGHIPLPREGVTPASVTSGSVNPPGPLFTTPATGIDSFDTDTDTASTPGAVIMISTIAFVLVVVVFAGVSCCFCLVLSRLNAKNGNLYRYTSPLPTQGVLFHDIFVDTSESEITAAASHKHERSTRVIPRAMIGERGTARIPVFEETEMVERMRFFEERAAGLSGAPSAVRFNRTYSDVYDQAGPSHDFQRPYTTDGSTNV